MLKRHIVIIDKIKYLNVQNNNFLSNFSNLKIARFCAFEKYFLFFME